MALDNDFNGQGSVLNNKFRPRHALAGETLLCMIVVADALNYLLHGGFDCLARTAPMSGEVLVACLLQGCFLTHEADMCRELGSCSSLRLSN